MVGSTIPGQAVLNCVRKLTKHERANQRAVVLHGSCFMYMLGFLTSLNDDL